MSFPWTWSFRDCSCDGIDQMNLDVEPTKLWNSCEFTNKQETAWRCTMIYHDIPWYTQDSRYFLSQTQSAESITYFYHSCCRKGAVVFQATPWTWSMKNSWHGRLLSWQGISMYIISIHIPIYPHNPEIPAPISYTNIQKIDIVHFLKNDIPMVSRCTPFFQVAFIMSVHIAEAWKVLSWSHGVFLDSHGGYFLCVTVEWFISDQ